MRRALAFLLPLGLLAACATLTPYQPLYKGLGYAEQPLEANRVRVSFAGSSATPRETVDNYLLYRAAELTLARRYDYFVIARSTMQASGNRSPDLNFGIGGFGFGSHTGLGIGVGTSTGGDARAYTAQAEIVMYNGNKPADEPAAFDAREVRDNLEAKIVRPSSH